MKCIDEEDFAIAGDFNSNTASNLMVVFELCVDSKRTTCNKDPVAINQYVEEAYILILENKSLFIHENLPT